MRAGLLLTPIVWSIVGPPESERYADLRPSGDDGGLIASTASIPPMARATAIRVAIPAGVFLRRSPPAVFGSTAYPGANWKAQTADLMTDSSPGFARLREKDGIIEQLVRVVEGSEGRASAMATGAGVSIAPPGGRPGRWSGAAWMLWRPDGANGLARAPLLGGSQAGGRIDYRLTSGRAGQLSLYGRVGSALAGLSSEEGALGIAFRPGRLPISLLAERRQRLGQGGRNGFALLAAGGIGPREVVRRIETEGYAQAGMVGLPGLDGFADGKMSVGYRLLPSNQRRSLTLGASLSGSIQPGASRLDVGPELRLRLPLGPASVRLSTEWRQRIAGNARPASGPAVTLAADF
jgi:hypothetical protein